MSFSRRLSHLALALALSGLALTGCGGDDSDGASGSDDHNAADVGFATEMIPHHEQALLMVDMTEGRDLSPEFEQLTEDIEAAQAPEIEQMQGWLETWDEKVPTSGGHMMSGMDGMGTDGAPMGPGMMSDDDLTGLEGTAADAFEAMWLRMMISHHEGAIEMAKTEIADGKYGPSVELAHSIVDSQTKEIEHMKAMLGES